MVSYTRTSQHAQASDTLLHSLRLYRSAIRPEPTGAGLRTQALLTVCNVDHETTDPQAETLRVRVLTYTGPFNFAAMNNRTAESAAAEVLLLLNNDNDIQHSDWPSEMVRHVLWPDVGVAGADLLHRNGTPQHGGIVLRPEGRTTHLCRGAAGSDPGYLAQLATTRDVAVVTGACVAIRQAVYLDVGGMGAC